MFYCYCYCYYYGGDYYYYDDEDDFSYYGAPSPSRFPQFFVRGGADKSRSNITATRLQGALNSAG